MDDVNHPGFIEEQIGQWRSRVAGAAMSRAADVATMEAYLRTEIAGLTRAGLANDEAFLVAVKRIGRRDGRADAFAREQTGRVWKPLPLSPDAAINVAASRKDAMVAFGCAVLAAVAIKLPALFGVGMHDGNEAFYLRNASLFVLPSLIGYFAWKRRLAASALATLAAIFAVAAVFANLPGFGAARGFVELTALHLPIALLLTVGIVHAGGRWRDAGARMDFIRFSGELFIYYVLIALGGGVLCAFMALTFKSIDVNIGPFFGSWVLPCGATGAVIVASWLVESKKGMMESMAPMLTRLFTPLFAVMLVAFLVALLWLGRGIDRNREMLIGFDLLLVVVLGLLLYSLSARNPQAPPGAFDVLQVILVVSALAADVFALWAIGARISEFGFTPNRVAGLGENLILLVNLAGSAVLYLRFLLQRGSFQSLERWQTGYVPVYSIWGAVVVIVFPILFRAVG